MVSERELQECWRRYERAEGLTGKQIRAMLKQVQEALPYLQARSDEHGRLAVVEARMAEAKLVNFEAALKRTTASRKGKR
jgi:hypothetical protein